MHIFHCGGVIFEGWIFSLLQSPLRLSLSLMKQMLVLRYTVATPVLESSLLK